MRTVAINGTRLAFVQKGTGETVVFVHGSASDLRTWYLQQEAFANQFRTIAYSRRYHWPNPKIVEGAVYAVEEHVNDLEAVLRSLGPVPVHLVGHSYGGYICLLLATQAPHLLRSLVLAEPPALTLFVSVPPKPLELLRLGVQYPHTAIGIIKLGLLGLAPAGSAFQRGDSEKALRLLGRAILGPKAFESLTKTRMDQVRENLIREEAVGSKVFLPLRAEHVCRLRVPTLLVGAKQSPRVHTRLLDHLESLLSNSERIEIPQASHLMHEDNPMEYNRAVLSFLLAHRQEE
jgi:non-heme chloroperoxidase